MGRRPNTKGDGDVGSTPVGFLSHGTEGNGQRGGSRIPSPLSERGFQTLSPHPLSYKPGEETHLHGLVRSVSILESWNLLFIPAPSLTEHESVIPEEGSLLDFTD